MKKAEVRKLLEHFWSLEGTEQEKYCSQEILPHVLDAVWGREPKFIQQMVVIIKEKERRGEGPHCSG